MLGKTHSIIAEKICKDLELSERNTALLKTGSTLPDFQANFPHHFGKELEIMEEILTARRLFLEGDDECYTKLGIALHYVQDRWTLRPRTADMHTQYEYEIDASSFLSLASLELAFLNVVDSTKVKDMIEHDQLAKSASSVFLGMPTNALKTCLRLVQILRKIKEEGLKAWFEGALIHAVRTARNYDSLDTEAPDLYTFSAEIHKGMAASALVLALAERPTAWSAPILDLNFSYEISRSLTRHILQERKMDGEKEWNRPAHIYDYSRDPHMHGSEDADMSAMRRAWRQAPHNFLVLTSKELSKVESFAEKKGMAGALEGGVNMLSFLGDDKSPERLLDSLMDKDVCSFGKPRFF